jgi:hypothetical protein
MVINIGYLSAPNESLSYYGNVDFKVFMDLEFNAIANSPSCFGIYGIELYGAGYADEEYVRWGGKLWRHYCIEGKATLLSDEYGFTYRGDHLANGDFDTGLEGWTVRPAEPDSLRTGRFDGYSYLQGRYPRTTHGDTFLIAKRSAARPNVFSQTIRNLGPGRVYCLRIFSSDYGELLAGKSQEARNSVSIRLENVEPIDYMSFDQPFSNCYSHIIGPFDANNKYWMTYHQRIFRARGATAKLTVTDWASAKDPGGPIGQELTFNFFEVQPFLMP